MKITPCGSVPNRAGPGDYFTGAVWLNPVIAADAPARLNAALVHFAPGARTFWHTHPLGQTLHVVSGSGLAQSEGGPVQQIRAGDTIWFSAGEKHWHGAGPDTAMSHMAMQEALDGVTAEWMEQVSEEDYGVQD